MSKTVLIVEDEKVLQDAYRLILSLQGFTVETANNGAEGLQKLRTVKPDLVLLDLFMPVMDGREFLRNVDLSEYPGTKIVVCTNMSDPETEAEMIELGAHRFVLKSNFAPKDIVGLAKEMTA